MEKKTHHYFRRNEYLSRRRERTRTETARVTNSLCNGDKNEMRCFLCPSSRKMTSNADDSLKCGHTVNEKLVKRCVTIDYSSERWKVTHERTIITDLLQVTVYACTHLREVTHTVTVDVFFVTLPLCTTNSPPQALAIISLNIEEKKQGQSFIIIHVKWREKKKV